MTNNKPTQDQINKSLWSACDTFRGAFDSSEYKNYILVFMRGCLYQHPQPPGYQG